MKRTISVMTLVTALSLACAMAAIAESAPAAGASGGKTGFTIALNVPTLQYEFFAKIGKDLQALGKEKGFSVKVDGCDMDLNTQASQLQNYISMKVDYIAVVPVETFGLVDTMTKCKAAGIKVINLLGSLKDNKGAYDFSIVQDNYAVGKGAAELAADWINATFPNAANGSIQVAVFEKNTDPDAKSRSKGLHAIEQLTPKAKVVVSYDFPNSTDTQQKAQEFASSMFVSNPDVKCILAYSADMSTAIDETCLTKKIAKPKEFAIYSVDWTQLLGQKLSSSVANGSYIRGTSACWVYLAKNIYGVINGSLKLDSHNEFASGSWKVTPKTIDEYVKITGAPR
jgi:ribose transport system substrate-binding protein